MFRNVRSAEVPQGFLRNTVSGRIHPRVRVKGACFVWGDSRNQDGPQTESKPTLNIAHPISMMTASLERPVLARSTSQPKATGKLAQSWPR